MTGLQIPADSSHVPFQSSPGKAAPALLTLPPMTYMVSSPLSVSILTFGERKYCSPSQPFDRAEFHDLSVGRGDIWVPGMRHRQGQTDDIGDLGGWVSQEQGELGLWGPVPRVPGCEM